MPPSLAAALAAAEQQLRTIEAARTAAEAEMAERERAVLALINERCRSWRGWAWSPHDGTIQIWLTVDIGVVGALLASGFPRVVLHDHTEAAHPGGCSCREYTR